MSSHTTFPSEYTAYGLYEFKPDLSGLEPRTRSLEAELKASEILIKIHAVSLNARDLQIATGTYPAPHLPPAGLIPISDGSGQVVRLGSAVDRFKLGDRVVTNLCQDWIYGEMGNEMQRSALGGGIDGVLAEYRVLDQKGVLKIPDHMSYAQASTLPIAALTAYHCLFGFERTLQPGQTLLVEGTGGVSLAALQFALISGARPIVISSSDAKLARCRALGVAERDLINYKTTPEWPEKVRELTGGRGVDHTVEIGGRDTLAKAISCAAPSGCVWIVGYLDDYKKSGAGDNSPEVAKSILYTQAVVRGVMCGSRNLFEQMLRAYALAETRSPGSLVPVIDRVFGFREVREAFELLRSQDFFGKIVIDVAGEGLGTEGR